MFYFLSISVQPGVALHVIECDDLRQVTLAKKTQTTSLIKHMLWLKLHHITRHHQTLVQPSSKTLLQPFDVFDQWISEDL